MGQTYAKLGWSGMNGEGVAFRIANIAGIAKIDE